MKNIRSSLRQAYDIIVENIKELRVSPWITDNFYIIDRHFKTAVKDKKSLSNVRLYHLLKNACEEYDYVISPKRLIKHLSAQKIIFSYDELCSVRTLLSACAIEKIASVLTELKGKAR